MKHTKANLLENARQLFNKNGFVNVRLQHIADEGHVSVGNLAYHFVDKKCLVEALYEQLKQAQEVALYEFRMAHLFEDIDRQLRAVFHCQQQHLFFYLDTLEVLRAYPCIRKKHQQHIAWQLEQIEWMFHFNVDRNTFRAPVREGQYEQLAWLFWLTMDNWLYARSIKGQDHGNEDEFVADLWSLMAPHLTPEAEAELKLLSSNSALRLY